MTTPTLTELVRNGNRGGERVELARYRIPAGERVVHGQRINDVVRVTDNPVGGPGRAYLVERELEQDGNAALQALVADYVEQANRHGEIENGTLRWPRCALEKPASRNSDERPVQPEH